MPPSSAARPTAVPPGSHRRPTRRGALAMLGVLLAAALVAAGCGAQETGPAPETIRIGLVPNQAPEKVQAEYEPLKAYMERELGKKVELDVPTSYTATVEAMVNDRIDVALFGGLTYVQARERAEIEPLVTDINPETGTTKYRSAIIVPAESDIRSVDQIKGKTFAFGSTSSTSGSLYPSIMLMAAGIDYRTDLGRTTYTGGHDAAAAAVASGKVDAGGLERRILQRLERDGTVDGSKVREIEVSEPIEGYPWVVRESLDPELRDQIAEAFLTMKDPKLLDLLHAKGFERVSASDYDPIEKSARELDLLTPAEG